MTFHDILSAEAEFHILGLIADKSCHGLRFHLDLYRLLDNVALQWCEIDPYAHFALKSELYRLDASRVLEVIEAHDRWVGTAVQLLRLSCENRRIPTLEEAKFLIDTFNRNFANIPGYEEGKHIILLVNYDVTKIGVLVQVLRYLSIFGPGIVKGCNLHVDGTYEIVDYSSYLYSKQIRGKLVR